MVQVVSDWTRGQMRMVTGGLVLERTIRIVSETTPEGNKIRAAGPSVTLKGPNGRVEVIRLDVFHPEDPEYTGGPHWHSVVHDDDPSRLNEGVSERLPLNFNPKQWFRDHLDRKSLVEIMLTAERFDVADWLEEAVNWDTVQADIVPALGGFLYDEVLPLHEIAALERPD